ncbi:polysaccharide biosynthesis protein [Bacillaceae bacterium W0354]
MTYRSRIIALLILDSLIIMTAIYISSYILYDTLIIHDPNIMFVSMLTLLISHHIFAFIFGLYKKSWEYASIGELIGIFMVVTLALAATGIIQFLVYGTVTKRALLVTWMLHLLLIGGSRLSWRLFRDQWLHQARGKKRTLIIGAGAAGTMICRQLLTSQETELKPIAFIDDDKKKDKLQFYGVPVLGGSKDIEAIVTQKKIEHIIIAIPSLTKEKINHIFEQCAKTNVKTQIMPKIEDIMTGKVSVNQFRDVEVEDLLGREPVELDIETISEKLTNKVVLVTGAGGSIGSEICRQVAKFAPEQIILLGHGENSIYQIDMELRNEYNNQFEITPIIADIQDRNRMFNVIEHFQPDVIYHAAAHKHVPLMEYNPKEAVKNNIFGTKNVADAAEECGVNTFVLISSDKAVNPTNVMGATKRVAEMIVQMKSRSTKTKFVAVRFGNVLGSRGSVIPLFKKQILSGGPVTVTHPDMTRYFMTIPEASRLVIQSGALARGGEVFVLDMGEPVKIVDLAKNLIRLSGYKEEDIGIKYTGIRPGEKMYEELLNDNEITNKQVFPKIYIGKASFDQTYNINQEINRLLEIDDILLKDSLLNLINVDTTTSTKLQTS